MRRPRLTPSLFIAVAGFALGGCGGDVLGPGEVRPPCPWPAPLKGVRPDRVMSFVIMLREGVDPMDEAGRLGLKYDFLPSYVFHSIDAFVAPALSDAVVARVRCEATVRSVEYDQFVRLDGVAQRIPAW